MAEAVTPAEPAAETPAAAPVDLRKVDSDLLAHELEGRGYTCHEDGACDCLLDDDETVDDELHDMAAAWKLGRHDEVRRILHAYLQDRLAIILP